MAEQQAARVPVEVVDRAGLLDLPRRWSDLWIVPKLWTVAKTGAAVVAVYSAGFLAPVVLEALLLGTSGLGLVAHLRRRRSYSDSPTVESSHPAVALAELRDEVDAGPRYGGTFGNAALLSVAPAYFGVTAAVTLGLLGTDPLGLSPIPWIVATAFTALPAGMHWAHSFREWRRLRRAKSTLGRRELDEPTTKSLLARGAAKPSTEEARQGYGSRVDTGARTTVCTFKESRTTA